MAFCKIFDPYPKSSREEFFDNEEIINEVEKLLEGKFWPLVVGPKRTGKTSILKIVSNELGGVYIDASGIKSLKELGETLIHSIQAKIQIDLKVVRVEIIKKPVKGLQDLLNKIGDVILLIDEVQNIISPWFISLLSNAYNNSEVRFAFTGSMIGLSKTLVGQGRGSKLGSSFKGRPIVEIEARPFDDDRSKEFLKFGSKMCNLSITDYEVEDAVKVYRGIQGWLTYYGNFRSLGYSHDKAKEMVLKIATSIIRDEIKLLSETQRAIIKALSLVDSAGWKNLKNLSESISKREFKDWVFNNALKQLVNARLVKKGNDGKYSLIDPMYKYLVS
ncbi:MAG: ATP-binding protein [Sulfolobaceae archaeon]